MGVRWCPVDFSPRSHPPGDPLHAVHQNPPSLSFRSFDIVERAIHEPRNVLRPVIVKIQPQEAEASGLLPVEARPMGMWEAEFKADEHAGGGHDEKAYGVGARGKHEGAGDWIRDESHFSSSPVCFSSHLLLQNSCQSRHSFFPRTSTAYHEH